MSCNEGTVWDVRYIRNLLSFEGVISFHCILISWITYAHMLFRNAKSKIIPESMELNKSYLLRLFLYLEDWNVDNQLFDII